MEVVSNSIFRRRKGVELLWDKVYAGTNPIFLQTPGTLVMQAIEGRKPGKTLDVGMSRDGTRFTWPRKDGTSPASIPPLKAFALPAPMPARPG